MDTHLDENTPAGDPSTTAATDTTGRLASDSAPAGSDSTARRTVGEFTGEPRRLPRWSEVRDLLGFQAPSLSTEARLQRCATVADVRRLAERRAPRSVFDYTDGAADDESSLQRSRDLWHSAEFSQHVLRDVSEVDLGTEILGAPAEMPLVLGPTGFTRMMHHEGELAVAHEARRAGLPYAISTMGTTPLEEVAQVSGPSPHYFQLYLWKDRAASTELVERAGAAGYSSLVLTVDTAVSGNRLRDVHNGMTIPPRLTPKTFLDMSLHPRWWLDVLTTKPLEFASLQSWEGTVSQMIDHMFDPSVTWAEVEWLREIWPGSIVVKGIQSAEDAAQALRSGADAVLLSNHGGRQIGQGRPPLRILPEVRDQLGEQTPIFLDGGVMSGSEIAAGVALGADAVWIGRAYLYGLMAGGHLGVRRVLEILRTELRRTMQLLGVHSVAELRQAEVRLPREQ